MGDRMQRVKGKAEEVKGRTKREAGAATGRPGTEARGAGEELKGKARNAVGKARSAVKKNTRWRWLSRGRACAPPRRPVHAPAGRAGACAARFPMPDTRTPAA